MKKWIIISVLLAAALLLLFFAGTETGREAARSARTLISLIFSPGDKEIDPASLIPAGASGYLRIENLEEAWHEITANPVWKNLLASPLWPETGIEAALAAARRELGEGGGILLSRATLMEAAGKDFALAVYPPGPGRPAALIIISRTGIRARAAEALARLADLSRGGRSRLIGETSIDGRRIFSIAPSPAFPYSTAYTFLRGRLAAVISPGPVLGRLRDLCDREKREGGEGTLLTSRAYQKGLRSLKLPPPASLTWYIRPRQLNLLLAGEGFSSFFPPAAITAAGSIFLEDGLRGRFSFRIPEAGFTAAEESSDPRIDTLLPDYPPAESLIYLSFRLDPRRLRAGFIPAAAGLREEAGKTTVRVDRDIIPLLGGEGRLIITPADPNRIIPLPEWSLALTVTDSAAAGRILETLAARMLGGSGMIAVREKLRGRTITVFSSPFLPEISYLAAEKMLICATSRKRLAAMIDRLDGSSRLPDPGPDPYFIPDGGADRPDILFYLNRERAAAALVKLAEWYLPLQVLFDGGPAISEQAYRSRLLPILKIIRPLRSIRAGINFKDTVVNGELYCYIPSSP